MSIIKRSNIPCFVLDHDNSRLRALTRNGLNLIEDWHMPKWLSHYSIDYNTIDLAQATEYCWLPVAVNFYDFATDYLRWFDPAVIDRVQKRQLRILIYYREADDPVRIRQHLDAQARNIGIDPSSILLISGNSRADTVDHCVFFWHFDCNYLFQTMQAPHCRVNHLPRSHNITCLSRVPKNWRKTFVYNLLQQSTLRPSYISQGSSTYGNTNDDFVIWHKDNLSLPGIGPLSHIRLPGSNAQAYDMQTKVDDLSLDQHNDHSIIVEEHFQNAYWNVILETLLATENEGSGTFVTEKTLKPIRNGQSFVVLGCQHTLEFLRERGYKTFGHVIDESYDIVADVRQRWYRVFEIAKYLMHLDPSSLESLQHKSLPAIIHNQSHFQRSRRQELLGLVHRLCQ